MKFAYRVRNRQGKMQKGFLEAENKDLVIESLLGQGLYIISLQKIEQSGQDLQADSFSWRKVNTRDMVIFTRQLSTMMASGLSILRAFRILGEQTSNKKLRQAVREIRDDIESGLALWEAMAKHAKIFSPVYISMVRAGELGGVLDGILERLGEHMEREQEINSKVKSASIYPAIISIFAVLVVFFIVTFVMPTFVGMFQAAGAELPWATQILLKISDYLRYSWIYVLGGFIGILFIIRRVLRTPPGKLFIDNLILHLPVIGKTVSRIIVARFARTMGTLVRSGIPVLQAMEVVEDVVGNTVVSQAIRNARSSIREGDSITMPLQETGVFEPMVTQMIAVGEETGSLDSMLIRMSDYYEKEVMYSIDALMSVLEPLLIMLVALLVGGIIVATLLPIFSLMETINL